MGLKTVRHTLLVTTLIAVALIATSYVFLLGIENKNMITEMNTIFANIREEIHALDQQITYQNNAIIDGLAPVLQTEPLPADAINAIVSRSLTNGITLQKISIFTQSGTTIAGTHVWANPSFSTVRFDEESQFIEYWKQVDKHWIAISHDVGPIISDTALTIRSTLNPLVLAVTYTEPEEDLLFEVTKEGVNIRSAIPEYTQKKESIIPTSLFEIASQQKPIELVDATSDDYHILLTTNTAVLHVVARKLLFWLLIVSLPLLMLTALLARQIGKSITDPIYEIAAKLQSNQDGVYQQSIHTKDELEQLDSNIAKITANLSQRYENLETKVERTAAEIMKYSSREHAIFDAISLGIMVVDKEGIIQEANRSIANLLGSNVLKLINTSIYESVALKQKQVELSNENHPVFKALTEKREIRIQPDEHVSIDVSNSTVPVRIIVTPIVLEKETRGAVVVIQDATEEYKVEQLKNEFIGVASHQLRTPLASIQWYSELLSSEGSENFTNEQRKFMVELRLAAQKLSNVINELMDASRLHDGQIEIRPQQVELTDLLKDTLKEFKALATVKHINLHIDEMPEELRITTDPVLLNIVVQNLVSNAIKYSLDYGEVTIALELIDNAVKISVHDNGIGVPHKDKDYIFQKMYRGSNAKQISTDGSGLGLYATRKILRILGGSISFVSQEGKGTTFTITLPRIEKSTD